MIRFLVVSLFFSSASSFAFIDMTKIPLVTEPNKLAPVSGGTPLESLRDRIITLQVTKHSRIALNEGRDMVVNGGSDLVDGTYDNPHEGGVQTYCTILLKSQNVPNGLKTKELEKYERHLRGYQQISVKSVSLIENGYERNSPQSNRFFRNKAFRYVLNVDPASPYQNIRCYSNKEMTVTDFEYAFWHATVKVNTRLDSSEPLSAATKPLPAKK